MRIRQTDSAESLSIPGTLNIVLSLLVWAGLVACLLLAANADSWGLMVIAAMAFAFLGNTCFALIHESVHGIFHPNSRINDLFGTLGSAFFPASFSFHRLMHLGHHARNRTDAEMFDLYYPSDNLLLKRMQIYSILTGPYWLATPIGCLLFTFAPGVLESPWLRSTESQAVRHSGTDAMLSGLKKAPGTRIRLETLLFLAVQAGLWAAMGWNILAWFACYWAFAVLWGALQYTDHAFAPRDIKNGAWNLKVNPVIKLFFLNYHDHKVHHQHPSLPWIHLPKFVGEDDDGPGWFRNYLRLWAGPEPAPQPPPDAGRPSASSKTGMAAVSND